MNTSLIVEPKPFNKYVCLFSFRYVLTRALNSDPVESVFSCFRQFSGGNDRMDARSSVFTAEKLLKVSWFFSAILGSTIT